MRRLVIRVVAVISTGVVWHGCHLALAGKAAPGRPASVSAQASSRT